MTEEPTLPATEPLSSGPADPRDEIAVPRGPTRSEGSTGLQALLASVEELRALLAPLTDQERRQVLELARSLRHPKPPAT